MAGIDHLVQRVEEYVGQYGNDQVEWMDENGRGTSITLRRGGLLVLKQTSSEMYMALNFPAGRFSTRAGVEVDTGVKVPQPEFPTHDPSLVAIERRTSDARTRKLIDFAAYVLRATGAEWSGFKSDEPHEGRMPLYFMTEAIVMEDADTEAANDLLDTYVEERANSHIAALMLFTR